MNVPFVVGIDCSKDTFALTVMDAERQTVSSGEFANHVAGIKRALKLVRRLNFNTLDGLFVVENTGVYTETLIYKLAAMGCQVAMVDGLRVRNSVPDKYHKTDLIDSAHIAEYGIRYADKIQLWEPKKALVQRIEALLVGRRLLVKHRSALKNQRKALELKYLDVSSAIQHLNQAIDQHTELIKKIDSDVESVIEEDPQLAQGVALLRTIPGVGPVLATDLLVYTNGFVTIPTYPTAAAHLGIAPRPYSSGTSVDRPPRSRRFGPRSMRATLHMSARSIVQHRAEGKKYWAQKKAAGKHGNLILNNLANKQLRLALSVLRNWKPFDENHRGVNPIYLT